MSIHLSNYQSGVNFINILCARFSYKSALRSFYIYIYILVRKMLMKLTPEKINTPKVLK
jgi:hypothetical protein